MIQKHKIDRSIINPSVPWEFIERWNFDPADSFNLLPIVDVPFEDWSPEIPKSPALAPVIAQYIADGDYWEWRVVRCPHCGGQYEDTHSTGGVRLQSHRKDWKTDGWRYELEDLGWQYALYCPETSSPPSERFGKRNMYYVGIDRAPVPRELDKYFPVVNYYARRKSTAGKTGGLYLIKAANRYKIGISGDVPTRVSSIATSSPFPVEVVHIEQTDNYANLEKYIHKTFAGNRVHREWFEFDESFVPTVIETIQEWA